MVKINENPKRTIYERKKHLVVRKKQPKKSELQEWVAEQERAIKKALK